jgi:hypothetical protein
MSCNEIFRAYKKVCVAKEERLHTTYVWQIISTKDLGFLSLLLCFVKELPEKNSS